MDDIAIAEDPREAIIAAYAAMEIVLDRYGAGRRPVETPNEYAIRLARTELVSAGAMSGLTRLYEIARYSTQQIGASMRAEAIAALVEIRDAL